MHNYLHELNALLWNDEPTGFAWFLRIHENE